MRLNSKLQSLFPIAVLVASILLICDLGFAYTVINVPGSLTILPAGFSRQDGQPFVTTQLPPGSSQLADVEHQALSTPFVAFDANFSRLLGSDPGLRVLAENDAQFAHEGPVWLPASNEVFFVSNLYKNAEGLLDANATAINIDSGVWRYITGCSQLVAPNGAFPYQGKVAVTVQGRTANGDDQPAGIVVLDPYSGQCYWLLNNFLGLQFNGPNDIVADSNGSIWFTDPAIPSSQGLRGPPQLGQFVWKYDPSTGSPPRMVADNFAAPNGLALSPDETTLYVSDTGTDTPKIYNPPATRTIFAFDLSPPANTFLKNRRVYAYSDDGVPDGIKLDKYGNVWGGTMDGLTAWNAAGDMIGKVLIQGGSAQFVFVGSNQDSIIVLNEEKVLRIDLSGSLPYCSPGLDSCPALGNV